MFLSLHLEGNQKAKGQHKSRHKHPRVHLNKVQDTISEKKDKRKLTWNTKSQKRINFFKIKKNMSIELILKD